MSYTININDFYTTYTDDAGQPLKLSHRPLIHRRGAAVLPRPEEDFQLAQHFQLAQKKKMKDTFYPYQQAHKANIRRRQQQQKKQTWQKSKQKKRFRKNNGKSCKQQQRGRKRQLN